MTALSLPRPVFDRRAMMHGIAGGTVWGATVATALLGFAFYHCGTVCLGQIVETAALSIAAGIVAIGPLALFRREGIAPSQ